MDFAALSNSLKQFMDIFDKANISSDTVLKNPQDNKPSKELVAEFEKYMQEPMDQNSMEQEGLAENDVQSAETENVNAVQSADPPAAEPIQIQEVQSSEQTDFSVKKPEQTGQPEIPGTQQKQSISVEPQEYLQEIQEILTQISNNSLTTQNLFRLQYLTSMLNVQVSQNNSVSKSSTEQFETILKQQG